MRISVRIENENWVLTEFNQNSKVANQRLLFADYRSYATDKIPEDKISDYDKDKLA